MKKPIPILLLAVFFAWSGLSGLWHFKLMTNTMVGMGIFGAWFRWYQILIIPLNLAMAFGLWARKEWGRILTLVYFGFGIIRTGFSTITLPAAMLLGDGIKGHVPSAMGFPMVILLGVLTYSILIFNYLKHRKMRQYFQGTVSGGETHSNTNNGVGYAGILVLFGATILPYLWAKTVGGPSIEEAKQMLAGGKNQAAIIAVMEKRAYPPLLDLEKEAASTPGRPNSLLLQRMAQSAYAQGQYDKAKKYAVELLQLKSPNGLDGDAIHHGNIILGRLALREGNVEEAKARLLAAGNTPGSSPLNSFGPNMALAEELLEKNERAVVLQYFGLCRRFWKMGKSQLDAWTTAVEKGEIPSFMANLIY